MLSAADFPAGASSALSGRFDILIVGGGAVGCAVAWEAASRGLRTALVERDDFGAGTSANSLRIVHGGLRYLQHLDLRRARACSRERAIMLRIAPHLVSPLECVVPTFRSLRRGRVAFASGLVVNRLLTVGHSRMLAASHRIASGGLISKEELTQRAPGLEMAGVTGGAQWFDACMRSGERLALAFALSAKERGAALLNHVEVERSFTQGRRITGVAARDRLTGEYLELAARVVLDCRGGELSFRPTLFGEPGFKVDFVKAVNIVLADKGLACAVGAPARNVRGDPVPGRLFFALPVNQTTVVGTWYFDHDSRNHEVLPVELQGILHTINGTFPGWRVTRNDILGVHVGFLPAGNATASEPTPIDHPLLVESGSKGGLRGLWHVQTEKWTTVRALAERVVDTVVGAEGLAATPSRTSKQTLVGGDPLTLTPSQIMVLSELSAEQSLRITSHYGSRVAKVLDLVRKGPSLAEPVRAAPAIIRGELAYVLDYEQVRTLKDLLRRLAPAETCALPSEAALDVAAFMAEQRAWSDARRKTELQNFQNERSRMDGVDSLCCRI